MIEINLLPKQYHKKGINLSFGKTGLYAIAGVIGIICMLAGVSFYQWKQVKKLDDNIAKARQCAAMLQKDIQLVDALLDVKNKIRDRMAAVERLDSHRSSWVRILENLASDVPEFVWLARFTELPLENPDTTKSDAEQAKARLVRPVEIEGYTFTLNALAAFMINLMRSNYFDKVELTSTTEKIFGEQKAYNFVLSCNLHYLSDEELRGLIAQANNPGSKAGEATRHQSLN